MPEQIIKQSDEEPVLTQEAEVEMRLRLSKQLKPESVDKVMAMVKQHLRDPNSAMYDMLALSLALQIQGELTAATFVHTAFKSLISST